MGGKIENRHQRILQLVRERGTIRVTELADELGVSQVTLRRDVAALESVGQLRRVQGSVSWPTAPLSARDARLARAPRVTAPRGLTIGMVVPTGDRYYRLVLQGAREAALAAGARLRIAITDYSPHRDLPLIDRLLGAGVDGLLLTPCWSADGPRYEECAPFAELPVPIVLVERRIPLGLPGAHLDRICSDHAAGAALGVEHLAALGHERIALLARQSHTMPQLLRGYHAATSSFDLPDLAFTPPTSAVFGEDPPDGMELLTRQLLGQVEIGEIDAAIVHTDADAINLIRRLQALGLTVPQDLALVSYDDELSEVSDIELSALAPAKRALGRGAVSLLLRRLAEPNARVTRTELEPELVVRDSCGASARSARQRTRRK